MTDVVGRVVEGVEKGEGQVHVEVPVIAGLTSSWALIVTIIEPPTKVIPVPEDSLENAEYWTNEK
jgi:shikimate kinase